MSLMEANRRVYPSNAQHTNTMPQGWFFGSRGWFFGSRLNFLTFVQQLFQITLERLIAF